MVLFCLVWVNQSGVETRLKIAVAMSFNTLLEIVSNILIIKLL